MSKKPSSGRRTRRVFNAEFKAKVALAALRQDKTLAQLCQQYQLHPTQINDWKVSVQPSHLVREVQRVNDGVHVTTKWTRWKRTRI